MANVTSPGAGVTANEDESVCWMHVFACWMQIDVYVVRCGKRARASNVIIRLKIVGGIGAIQQVCSTRVSFKFFAVLVVSDRVSWTVPPPQMLHIQNAHGGAFSVHITSAGIGGRVKTSQTKSLQFS